MLTESSFFAKTKKGAPLGSERGAEKRSIVNVLAMPARFE